MSAKGDDRCHRDICHTSRVTPEGIRIHSTSGMMSHGRLRTEVSETRSIPGWDAPAPFAAGVRSWPLHSSLGVAAVLGILLHHAVLPPLAIRVDCICAVLR